jgi:hypothetical protein
MVFSPDHRADLCRAVRRMVGRAQYFRVVKGGGAAKS